MFGLFQADLPIGNRLWLTLLAIIVGGSIAATPLAEVASNPVSFGVNLLLLFGQATLVSNLALVVPIIILGAIEISIKKRADNSRSRFFRETEDYELLTTRVASFFLIAGYVSAIFWIADGNFSTNLGAFGLALFLSVEVWSEWQSVYLRGYEHLELRKEKDSIKAHIIREESSVKFTFREDWSVLHAYLSDNNWELLEFSKSFALLRKEYQKGLLPKRWSKFLPRPFANFFGKRPIRKRKARKIARAIRG